MRKYYRPTTTFIVLAYGATVVAYGLATQQWLLAGAAGALLTWRTSVAVRAALGRRDKQSA